MAIMSMMPMLCKVGRGSGLLLCLCPCTATSDSVYGVLQAEELKSQLTLAVQGQKEAKDKMLLCLADMENLRARSAQQVETNRKFAVQVCIQ